MSAVKVQEIYEVFGIKMTRPAILDTNSILAARVLPDVIEVLRDSAARESVRGQLLDDNLVVITRGSKLTEKLKGSDVFTTKVGKRGNITYLHTGYPQKKSSRMVGAVRKSVRFARKCLRLCK